MNDEDVVKRLCESIENDINRWEIGTYTLDDRVSGIKYWLVDGAITEIWNGHSAEEVFTHDQGNSIRRSLNVLRSKKNSIGQQKVANSIMKTKSAKPTVKPWYKRLFN